MINEIEKNTLENIKQALLHQPQWIFSEEEMFKQLIKLGLKKTLVKKEFINIINYLINENTLEKEFFINNRGSKKYVLKTNEKLRFFKMGLSINHKAYLSHYSAMFLHNLTNNIPKEIYINLEHSSSKPEKQNTLTQANILKAMNSSPRITQNKSKFLDYTYIFLSGANTDCLGVKQVDGLRTTNIERTLIDIAISPYYAGGIFEVFNAYKSAKKRVNVAKMADMLKQLNYTYPYNQAIGFLLEKAGYKEEYLKLFEELGINYKFFLLREIPYDEREFNTRWKLFHPKFI